MTLSGSLDLRSVELLDAVLRLIFRAKKRRELTLDLGRLAKTCIVNKKLYKRIDRFM